MSGTSSIGASNSQYLNRISSRIQSYVSRTDQNADGQISLGEFNAAGQNLPSGSASSTDPAASVSTTGTAASGASSGSATDRSALFGQIDKDGDGQLSTTELTSYRQQQVSAARSALLNIQEVFGSGSKGSDSGSGEVRRGGHHHHGHRAASTGAEASTGPTASTSVTASAAASSNPLDALFKSLDGNGDGSVTKDEVSSFLMKSFGFASPATATAAAAA